MDVMTRSVLLLDGMLGLGDNIYQRAVLRQYLQRGDKDIYLQTPWPSIYHDMPQLKFTDPVCQLRTQRKNMAREGSCYRAPEVVHETRKIWYFAQDIHRGKCWGTLPNAMLGNMGCTIPGDYRLPVPQEWTDRAYALLGGVPTKPILVHRPLTFRQEWSASGRRNPDPVAYLKILKMFRDDFFVVSIADVDDKHEWFVGDPLDDPDIAWHAGELGVQDLVGLFSIADLVYAAPGFALALAQAVETAGIFVFGAHENSSSYRASANFAPFLGIDPIQPCDCFRTCKCEKTINIEAARHAVEDFLSCVI